MQDSRTVGVCREGALACRERGALRLRCLESELAMAAANAAAVWPCMKLPRDSSDHRQIEYALHLAVGRAEVRSISAIDNPLARHQFGRRINKGRAAGPATVAGTLIGAAIGHDHASSHHRGHEQFTHETRCTTYTDYHEEERIDGYRVTYQYRGQTLHTRLPYDPGATLRVRVQITPVQD